MANVAHHAAHQAALALEFPALPSLREPLSTVDREFSLTRAYLTVMATRLGSAGAGRVVGAIDTRAVDVAAVLARAFPA